MLLLDLWSVFLVLVLKVEILGDFDCQHCGGREKCYGRILDLLFYWHVKPGTPALRYEARLSVNARFVAWLSSLI